MLGLELIGNYKSESENVDEDIAVIGKGAARVEVDLMQPVDAQKRPAVHDPALNHIGLWVDDLAAAVEWLTQQGVRFTPGGIRKGAAGYDVCFIHPKGNEQDTAQRRRRADRARASAARRSSPRSAQSDLEQRPRARLRWARVACTA